jgi:NAD(P)H dehydrogenase (quinone)
VDYGQDPKAGLVRYTALGYQTDRPLSREHREKRGTSVVIRDGVVVIYAISGASGRLGRLAAAALLERVPASQVVLTTRTPAALISHAALGVVVRHADFDDPKTLTAAFSGVDRLLIISASNATGKREDQHDAAMRVAKEAGVKHIVFTSMPRVDAVSHPAGLPAQEYRAAETSLKRIGLGWTILRNAPYAELHVVERLPELFGAGRVVTNAGEGRAPFISRRDCAAVASAALVSDGHEGQTYDVSGPESLTWRDVTQLTSYVVGRNIEYVAVDDRTYRAQTLAAGAPPLLADALTAMGIAMREGYFDVRSDAVARFTGRQPTSLREVLIANRQALLTSVSVQPRASSS